jgi:hypothetical protein
VINASFWRREGFSSWLGFGGRLSRCAHHPRQTPP